VRNKGVMEKCNYCVQRISLARIAAKRSNNYVKIDLADGTSVYKPNIHTQQKDEAMPTEDTLVTACQQACPTQAIFFGDINDGNSMVKYLKDQPLNYVLLEDLQTLPRTSYLWRLNNPNQALLKV